MYEEYEGLLSKDPIGAFEKIKDDYLRYYKTMYHIKNEENGVDKYHGLNERKNEQLLRNNTLSKEPYCEILPQYESTGKSLSELCANEYSTGKYRALPDGFADFVSAGLMQYPPYRHQFEMLCKGYGEGKNVLITSGTGSGKTESFLLPLLASLLSEAQSWPQQSYNPRWFDQDKYTPSQRINEDKDRPAAIRALLLYPMNALVADQVSRLRKALDSDAVRNILDTKFKGNRIFFGSYNGETKKALKIEKTNDEKQFVLNPETTTWLQDLADKAIKLQEQVKGNSSEADNIYVTQLSQVNCWCSNSAYSCTNMACRCEFPQMAARISSL